MSEDTPVRERLRRAQEDQECVRILRRPIGVDSLDGWVLDLSADWLLLAHVPGHRLDGYVAVRLGDVRGVLAPSARVFYRRVAEATGLWPPVLPADAPIDLTDAESLIRSAHRSGGLVNVQVEESDPDEAYIGVPTTYTESAVWLDEVTEEGRWEGDVREWRYDDITRVQFGGAYERNLLLVAGPPPR